MRRGSTGRTRKGSYDSCNDRVVKTIMVTGLDIKGYRRKLRESYKFRNKFIMESPRKRLIRDILLRVV